MLKKIILWGVYASFVGLMIFGAINRTAARTEQTSENPLVRERQKGTDDSQGREREDSGSAEKEPKRFSGGEQGQGRGESDLSFQSGRKEKEHQIGEQEDHQWIHLSGEIIQADESGMIVVVEEEILVDITGRAWRFVQEIGYAPDFGDQVNLTGFYESSEFKPESIEDPISGELYLLRDPSGRPLWAGGGS